MNADQQTAISRRSAHGAVRMADLRVVLCGLTRDSAPYLQKTITRMESLGDLFGGYRVVVFENDSIDDTPALLDRWQRMNSRVVVLSERRNDPVNRPLRCPLRGDRMAFYRNQYREFITHHFEDFDFAIVVDMDILEGWSNDGVAHTFGFTDWDFVGSYGIIEKRHLLCSQLQQYDAWAFRSYGSYEALKTRTVNNMRIVSEDRLMAVYSCFGGLGIYRMPALLNCQYVGGDCEHVGLHAAMRESGFDRIFLNPNQTTHYSYKYNRLLRLMFRITEPVRRAWPRKAA
jgi:hypothetical protein